MKDVIRRVMDEGEFFEVFPLWARNILIGFARLDGMPVGIVGNQPQVLAGDVALDLFPIHAEGRVGKHVVEPLAVSDEPTAPPALST